MKILSAILLFCLALINSSYSDEKFSKWLDNYKKYAVNQGITKKTVDEAFANTKLLKRIISYDRNQPEFIETLEVYFSKRVNKNKINVGKKLIKKNISLLNDIEKKFNLVTEQFRNIKVSTDKIQSRAEKIQDLEGIKTEEIKK